MSYKRTIWQSVSVVLFFLLTIVSCKPGVPREYLQPDELTDILYDYHLADGIVSTVQSDDTIALRTYYASILRKHGVSQADFDSTLVYYTRHTQLLDDVYKTLADRIDAESVSEGGSSGSDVVLTSADTTNVWRESRSFVLTPYTSVNSRNFEIKADTSFHKGDKFVLDFDAQFIYQDGMRDASMVLAVTYENDSVEFSTNSVMSSTHYHLQIDNTGGLGIKSVQGLWILNKDFSVGDTSSSTLKILVVSNVRLIKMRKQQTANKIAPQDIDTLQEGTSPTPKTSPVQKPDSSVKVLSGERRFLESRHK